MRIEKFDGQEERRILIGMITSKEVLGRVAADWRNDPFRSSWANQIGAWCVDYYRSYEEAPGRAITPVYEQWASECKDTEAIKAVGAFLSSLSTEHAKDESISAEFVVDLAEKYFNRILCERLRDTVDAELSRGRPTRALDHIGAFSAVSISASSGIFPYSDKEALYSALEDQASVLVRYPGALGNFFGNHLERDGFISFMGPEKSGKSFWLIDLAVRAATQKNRVAFFSVGDMSQKQVMRRLTSRAAGRPWRSGMAKVPVMVSPPPEDRTGHRRGETSVDVEEHAYRDNLSPKEARDAMARMAKKIGDRLWLSVHANSTLSVPALKSALKGREREGWIADVVVIDYADILAPVPGSGDEERGRIHATWKALRALSQELHCLVVTATQVNRASYSADVLTRDNFSGDKRKLAEVTGMVGINVTDADKSRGVTRLNWIVLREGEYDPRQCVYVAGCHAISNPAIVSAF